LKLFGAGVDSGTYDYFTAAIVGKEHSSRGDFTASEDDNVLVQGVAGDVNAIGFFGLAYFVENKDKLKPVAIKSNETAKGVLPSVDNAKNGSYQPLSRPIFMYFDKKSLGGGTENIRAACDEAHGRHRIHGLQDRRLRG
jgi:phosphate transport system substrate-binding protein